MQFTRNEAPDDTVLQPISFVIRNLTSAKTHYYNIEKETQAKLHNIEMLAPHSFCCEVSVIKDHKPLVAILKKDVASQSN